MFSRLTYIYNFRENAKCLGSKVEICFSGNVMMQSLKHILGSRHKTKKQVTEGNKGVSKYHTIQGNTEKENCF